MFTYTVPDLLKRAANMCPHQNALIDRGHGGLNGLKTTFLEEIMDYCRKNLADYKVPRHVEFVTELPRNPAGKVLKWQLRDIERNKL